MTTTYNVYETQLEYMWCRCKKEESLQRVQWPYVLPSSRKIDNCPLSNNNMLFNSDFSTANLHVGPKICT